MSRQLVDERPTAVDTSETRRRPMEWVDLWNAFPAGTWVAAAAAVRGAVVALSGVVATISLAVVVWAITPQSGDDASAALHAGFAGLAAANLLPISIGGVPLTLTPLLLTLLLGVLLSSTARRGRFQPSGRAQESLATVVGGGVYGLLVLFLTRGFGAEGVVAAGAGPFVVGILGFGAGTLGRESAWRAWWRAVVPAWITAAVRAATVGTVALIGGAAALFAVSLGLHLPAALAVEAAVAPGGLDGAGLALLGLVYLPNAVLATVGFSVGAGVNIGPGSYLPWGANATELPGLPFIAALPTSPGPSPALVALAVPLLAAGLLGWTVVRRGLPTRQQRALAAVTAAVGSAVVVGSAVFAAGGGVGTGRWAVVGAPAPQTAGMVALAFAVVGVAITALTAIRTVPWSSSTPSTRATRRPARRARRSTASARRPTGKASVDPDGPDGQAATATADAEVDGTDEEVDRTADGETDVVGPADEPDEDQVAADADQVALEGVDQDNADPVTDVDVVDEVDDAPARARPDGPGRLT